MNDISVIPTREMINKWAGLYTYNMSETMSMPLVIRYYSLPYQIHYENKQVAQFEYSCGDNHYGFHHGYTQTEPHDDDLHYHYVLLSSSASNSFSMATWVCISIIFFKY